MEIRMECMGIMEFWKMQAFHHFHRNQQVRINRERQREFFVHHQEKAS